MRKRGRTASRRLMASSCTCCTTIWRTVSGRALHSRLMPCRKRPNRLTRTLRGNYQHNRQIKCGRIHLYGINTIVCVYLRLMSFRKKFIGLPQEKQ